jgi:hypothetical protein
MIKRNLRQYFAVSSNADKKAITEEIVDEVTRSGRFLQYDSVQKHWLEMDREASRIKVALSLQYRQRRVSRDLEDIDNPSETSPQPPASSDPSFSTTDTSATLEPTNLDQTQDLPFGQNQGSLPIETTEGSPIEPIQLSPSDHQDSARQHCFEQMSSPPASLFHQYDTFSHGCDNLQQQQQLYGCGSIPWHQQMQRSVSQPNMAQPFDGNGMPYVDLQLLQPQMMMMMMDGQTLHPHHHVDGVSCCRLVQSLPVCRCHVSPQQYSAILVQLAIHLYLIQSIAESQGYHQPLSAGPMSFSSIHMDGASSNCFVSSPPQGAGDLLLHQMQSTFPSSQQQGNEPMCTHPNQPSAVVQNDE